MILNFDDSILNATDANTYGRV